MATWKVLFIMLFALVCLGLAGATVVVPLTEGAAPYKWQWLGGLLAATIVVGGLFALFLRSADRAFKL